jgi:hypothetical protein
MTSWQPIGIREDSLTAPVVTGDSDLSPSGAIGRVLDALTIEGGNREKHHKK